jgi:hypothetical protein
MENIVVCPDVISYASQIGRLDFLSSVLAAIAIILGIGAIPLFIYLKQRAEAVARTTTENLLKDKEEMIEAHAISKIESMLPKLVEDYMTLVKNSVNDTTANQIAAVAGEVENDNDDRSN